MRFVSTETVRIDLKDGHWIEIKKELGKGAKAKYRGAGLSGVVQAAGEQKMPVDWEVLALARVEAYLVDWSLKNENGKRVTVSRNAIAELEEESFDEIDSAIKAHIEATDEEKKALSGSSSLTLASA